MSARPFGHGLIAALIAATAFAQQPAGSSRLPPPRTLAPDLAASVAVSWLDWQLRGDRRAAKRFVGKGCGLCSDARWTLQRKGFR